MKIILNRESFLKKLTTVHSIMAKKNLIPVTGSSLITFSDDGKMHIKSTNLRTSVSVFINIDSSEGDLVDFVCDTRTIQNVIQTLRSETVYIEVTSDSINFGVEGGRRKVYSIPLEYLVKDFPAIPELKAKFVFELNGPIFSALVNKLSRFILRDDIIMPEGILFQSVDKKLNLYAFSNVMVSYASLDSEASIDKPFYLHHDICNLVDSYKSSADLKMSLGSDMKFTHFNDGATEIFVRNIDGKTANPSKIIEGFTHSCEVVVSRMEFTESINRASSMLKADAAIAVKMNYKDDEVLISSEDSDFRSSAEESIKLESNDMASMSIGADYKKMSSCLAVMGSDFVNIKMSHPNKIFKISETEKSDSSVDVYMMPVMTK